MKNNKLIGTLCLAIALVTGAYAQGVSKAETKVKLIAEKNGKQEVFEKTIEGANHSFNKEDIEKLFGVKKSDYDNFMIEVKAQSTDVKDDGESDTEIQTIINSIDAKDGNTNIVTTSSDGKHKVLVIKHEDADDKDGKKTKNIDKKVIVMKGEHGDMSHEEMEKLLKEHGVDPKAIHHEKGTSKTIIINDEGDGMQHIEVSEDNGDNVKMKKIVVKSDDKGNIKDEDLKMLKEQGVELSTITGSTGEHTMIMVKIHLKELSKDDIANFNTKTSASLTASAPTLNVEQMNFYPNPNNGKFNLSFTLPAKGNTNIAVYDVTGRKVYNEDLIDFTGNYSKDIDLSKENKGNYIIQVQQNGQISTKQLVVE